MLRQHLANFLDFLGRGLFVFEQVQDQLAGRSGKHPLHQVAQQLAFHPGGLAGFIDMRLAILVAIHQPFGVHILQKFEYAGVADGPVRSQKLVNLAHGRWTAIPQDAENFDFSRSGFCCGVFCHVMMVNDFYRRVNEKNRTCMNMAAALSAAPMNQPRKPI